MKTFLTVFFFLLYSIVNCQSLSLFDVDPSNFPTIRAKFYAFDTQGNQQRPNISDLSLTENGIPRTITNISCPPLLKKERLSIVLLVDVTVFNGIVNAKNVLIEWVNQIDLEQNEVAIVSYERITFINQDFTTDKQRLLNAINGLETLSTYEDHDGAMIRPTTGAISVAEKGKYKKVVLLLSSCSHYKESQTQTVIDRAKQSNVSLNFVIFNKFDLTPHLTRIMAKNTGGFSINKLPLDDLESAKGAIFSILNVAQGGMPCLIEWKGDAVCKKGDISTQLSINDTKLSSTNSYLGQNTNIAILEVDPYSITFENPIIGDTYTKEVHVTAWNFPFTVQDIISSNPSFSISPRNFSLQPEQSQKLTVSFLANDSGYESSKFTFINKLCPKSFIVSSWHRNKPATKKSLYLTNPNGDELFIVGMDTIITWDGIPENEIVRIDYSIDNGDTWKFIDTARGLSYIWKNIPKPISSNCKIKVTQIKDYDNNPSLIIPHNEELFNVTISPNSEKILTGSNKFVRIWDKKEKKVLYSINGATGILKFSPDGKSFASGRIDSSIKIYDTETGQMIRILVGHSRWVYGLDYSKDGMLLASGSADKTIKIWDVSSGLVLQTLKGHKNEVSRVAFSPDGKTLVSAGGWDNTIKVWDVISGQEIRTINGHNRKVVSVVFSPNGSVFASCSYDKTVKIWDAASGELIRTLKQEHSAVLTLSFSPDGTQIATGSGSNLDMTVKLWDIVSGEVVRTFVGHTFWVNEVEISSDNSFIASCSGDSSLRIWYLGNNVLQSDQSDSVFAIVEPLGASTDIAMGEVLLGDDKDSVVVDFVRNVGSWNYDVRSVSFRGADASAFSLVSGMPTYRVEPNSSHFGEFRFAPSRVGLHQADVVIVTQSDTIVQTITGVGVENQLQIHATFIDFGEVEVGNERTIIDTLVLKNVGSNAITIEDTKLHSPDMEQFAILSGGGNFTLGAGEERLVTAQFKPKFIGRTSGRIGFEYNGIGSPAIAHLFGNGIGGLVYVPNDSGYVGDRKSIRLMLGNVKTEAIVSIAPKFKALLRIQNNLLAPINKANTFIQNDSMYFTLQGVVGTTSELAQIPIVVGLGNVDFSWIDIADFTFLDASDNPVDYDFEKQHGSYKILGICQEGGARLIHSSTPLSLLMVSPNPSDGKATIELNLIEDGFSTLKIYNSNGFLMDTYSFTTSGSRTIDLDTKNFSNGLYFITIETPTLFDKAKLLMVK